jgi:hypothetical protein
MCDVACFKENISSENNVIYTPLNCELVNTFVLHRYTAVTFLKPGKEYLILKEHRGWMDGYIGDREIGNTT